MQIQEAFRQFAQDVRSASFPVYGLTQRLTDFSLVSWGEGNFGAPSILNSITLTFSSPYYPGVRDCFQVSTSNNTPRPNAVARIVYDLRGPEEGAIFDFDTPLFRMYHLDEKVQEQAGSPRVWDNTISIAGTVFSIRVRHWASPYNLSLFLLKAEHIVLSGHANGPTLEELLALLQGLEIINQREDVLHQYLQYLPD